MYEEKWNRDEEPQPCRVCGVYYLCVSKYLEPLFPHKIDNEEMHLIRCEIARWNIKIHKNDGFPQMICGSCVEVFRNFFKLRNICIKEHENHHHFNKCQQQNLTNFTIKTEICGENNNGGVCVNDLNCNKTTTYKKPDTIDKLNLSLISKRNVNEYTENSKRNLEDIHQQIENKIPIKEVEKFECPICNRKFINATQSRIKFHLKWHNLRKNSKRALPKKSKRFIHSLQAKLTYNKFIKGKRTKCNTQKRRQRLNQSRCEQSMKADVFHSKIEQERSINSKSSHNPSKYANNTPNVTKGDKSVQGKLICVHCGESFRGYFDVKFHIQEIHCDNSISNNFNAKKVVKPTQTLQDNVILATYRTDIQSIYELFNDYEKCSKIQRNSRTFLLDELLNSKAENYNTKVKKDSHQYLCLNDERPKIFATDGQVSKHSTKHTANEKSFISTYKKPDFSCHVCDKQFNLQFTLNRHMRQKHSQDCVK